MSPAVCLASHTDTSFCLVTPCTVAYAYYFTTPTTDTSFRLLTEHAPADAVIVLITTSTATDVCVFLTAAVFSFVHKSHAAAHICVFVFTTHTGADAWHFLFPSQHTNACFLRIITHPQTTFF